MLRPTVVGDEQPVTQRQAESCGDHDSDRNTRVDIQVPLSCAGAENIVEIVQELR